jgi:hypothetical protein
MNPITVVSSFLEIVKMHMYANQGYSRNKDFEASQLELVLLGITDGRTHDNFISLASQVQNNGLNFNHCDLPKDIIAKYVNEQFNIPALTSLERRAYDIVKSKQIEASPNEIIQWLDSFNRFEIDKMDDEKLWECFIKWYNH